MDGILIIDKPEGLTSHDVVARVRRALGTRRVGHTGTLDPFATGVMVVLVGQTTRLAQYLDKNEKEYEATVRFGFETDTADRTGERTTPVDHAIPDATLVKDVLSRLTGDLEQVPPMYSAKKVAGKKLYEHARKGEVVERAPQKVTIRELEILDASQLTTSEPTLRLRVVCSAGTYIRVLAQDIGWAVGVGAHLAELRRTRAGRFAISDAVKLEDLVASPDPAVFLRPMADAVIDLPVFSLPDDRIERTLNGLSTRISGDQYLDGQPLRMTTLDGRLIAVGVYEAHEGCVRPKVVLR